MAWTIEFERDPAAFLDAAGGYLADRPVVSTVVSTIAERALGEIAAGIEQPEQDWYVLVRDGRAVVGAGMRNAPFAPRPLFLLPMPERAAEDLAHALWERGEEVGGANGALPAVRRFADATAGLTGGRVEVAQRTRLFELRELVRPRHVPGDLRRATYDDVDLCTAWFAAFMADADEQAGRPRGSSPHEALDEQSVRRRIDRGQLWLWVDDRGERVHLTGANRPSFGVARIGPVYTPPAERGRGWASAAVAGVSARLLRDGVRPCLFTDQANPTSNRIYQRLGYEPVTDMANLLITRT